MDFKNIPINKTILAKANLNLFSSYSPAEAGDNSGNLDEELKSGDKQELLPFGELPPFSRGDTK